MAESSTRHWYVWVTASSSDFAEQLVSKLVRRGFTVGPLGRTLILNPESNAACVVAMSIFRTPKNEEEKKAYTALGIYDEIEDVIKRLKGKFWSIVVGGSSECTWNVGNCKLDEAVDDEVLNARKIN